MAGASHESMRCLSGLLLAFGLSACTLPATPVNAETVTSASPGVLPDPATTAALAALANQLTQPPLPQAILLGEQHDVPEHQQAHRRAVVTLSGTHQLAAVVIEMAEQGQTTQSLNPMADEAAVRTALKWDTDAWPWAAYGPAVMTAVRAGVPVLGANLRRAQWRNAMQDTSLDTLLPPPALSAQQQAIRTGHCDLLPESQVAPMTRIQIARDRAMASTIQDAAQPGKTVLLLAGHGHVNRALGVPQHLPSGLTSRALLLLAAPVSDTTNHPAFDSAWALGTAPQTDYCAAFSATRPLP